MKKFVSLGLFVFLFETTLMANWVGGGGRIFNLTDNNPWFIENTPSVSYCIQHDRESFSAEIDTVRNSIQKALDYWKNEYGNARKELNYSLLFKTATQIFTQTACPDDIDSFFDSKTEEVPLLVFQFGTLTENQKSKIPDWDKHIGMAIRTDYDQQNLRGQGFIYLAADSGPLMPKGAKERELWARGYEGMLTLALIHEIGHIFGLKHREERYLMADNFLDQLYFSEVPETYSQFNEIPSYFSSRIQQSLGRVNTFTLCIDIATSPATSPQKEKSKTKWDVLGNGLRAKSIKKAILGHEIVMSDFDLDEFLGVPKASSRCYSIYESGDYDFDVFHEVDGVERKVAKISPSDVSNIKKSMESFSTLFLPDNQTIYPNTNGSLEGMGVQHYAYGGFIEISSQDIRRPIWLNHRGAYKLTIGTFFNGNPVVDIFQTLR